MDAISHRARAVLARKAGYDSEYCDMRVGSSMLQIFSVLMLIKLLLRLLIAAFFTSGSLSFRSRLNV